MRSVPLAVGVLASLILCTARSAAAADDAPSKAEALFIEGRDAMKRGESQAACSRFAESHALDPLPLGPLLNLAECEQQRGLFIEARAHFAEAATKLPETDPRRGFALQRERAVSARASTLSVVVRPPVQEGIRVDLDGTANEPLAAGEAFAVNPGHHALTVSLPNRTHRRIVVDLMEGSAREVVIDILSQNTPATSPPPSGMDWRKAAGVGAGGLAIAALGTALTTGLLSLDRGHAYRDGCGALGCTDEAMRAADEGRRFNLVTNVAAVTGVVALGVSAYLLLWKPADGPARTSRAASAGGLP